MSLRRLAGATLLEAIIVSALMGWLMAYLGQLVFREVQNDLINKSAFKIVNFQRTLQSFSDDFIWNTNADLNNGRSTMINPLFENQSLDPVFFPMKSLPDTLKNRICGQGTIPEFVSDVFLLCTFSHNLYPVDLQGGDFYFESYNNLLYPSVKRVVSQTKTTFTMPPERSTQEFFSFVDEIVNIKMDDGYTVSEDRIELLGIDSQGSPVNSTKVFYTDFASYSPEEASRYIDSIASNGYQFSISIYNFRSRHTDVLKADGTVPVAVGKSLCWNTQSSTAMPCIRASSDPADQKKEFLVMNAGLAYGRDKKRSPPQVSYHTFVNGQSASIPYLDCPHDLNGNLDGLNMFTKFAAIPSSFSSGSENSSNFTDPSDIISKGTKGASNEHAMLSGLSLEWHSDDATRTWIVDGAIGIDAAYDKSNNNSSVLRNPKSISFIAMQWCEEH